MKIETNKVVSIHYELTNEAGETLDSSSGKDPLTYLHGTGALIPGLEKELEGKNQGDELTAVIPPEQAYGELDQNLIRDVDRAAFGDVEKLEPGMQFQASGNNDSVQVISVVEVKEDVVTVDANHPLAGMTLTFDVKVDDVREVTEEELAHGHAH
ncbi:MAG: peptidylprolyl isomerase [Proteobacteria bacterium]|nr:peptidylprolyl isomerase [Pseudomonadota bacterium]MDA1302232.1 peptidylprolyl isomerase [Pseudomonadota bacterium]